MIDESIGKILGMAMAYGVSALGLFLAYANYRKRTIKADKVMTPKAWGVVAAVLLTIAGGVLVVAELAKPSAVESAAEETHTAAPEPGDIASGDAPPEDVPPGGTASGGTASGGTASGGTASGDIVSLDFEDPDAVADQMVTEAKADSSRDGEERSRWPLIGMVLPAIIFLTATWITAGLYRHFSAGDGTTQPGSST